MNARQGLILERRYALVRHIATGGMGSVWRAHDRELDRDVAIKLLAPQFLEDEAAVRRFMREARAAARLSGHPNVVTIFDVVAPETDRHLVAPQTDRHLVAPKTVPIRRPFLVMEYLAGGTVADALRVGAVTGKQALQWLREAAAALDFAHRQGVIHRDVKPSNLLLDRDRVLHVGDFGIARLRSEDTLTGAGQLVGTAAYLAPERVLGGPATEASDRYALAVVAFELLVGRRPFTAEHFAAQARQHVEQPPPAASRLNPRLPPRLDAVLARGMAKRPEERWPTAGSFVEAIAGALARTAPGRRPVVAAARTSRRATPAPCAVGLPPTEAVPAGGSAAAVRDSRGRVALAAALAVAALVLAVALAAAGGSPSTRRPARLGARTSARQPAGRPSQPRSPVGAPPTMVAAQFASPPPPGPPPQRAGASPPRQPKPGHGGQGGEGPPGPRGGHGGQGGEGPPGPRGGHGGQGGEGPPGPKPDHGSQDGDSARD
jgi:hypothetical protein